MRVSVVVCTYNRAGSLALTLEALRHQTHPDLEVVVVNGPSTDGTDEVLRAFRGDVKMCRRRVANLSMSRNIGICAASGDLIAFIDDDALPEFNWLTDAVIGFDADDVAGVGGIVFDHTGMALQYRFSAADRFGNAMHRDSPSYEDLCIPGSAQFPYLQGTNCLFRRRIMEEVGGFDETYDYFLDETDLCCRIVDCGYRLRQLDGAPVHHKFLPSAVRDHQRVVTNWFPIVKNHTYFGYRHALDTATPLDVLDDTRRFMGLWLDDIASNQAEGHLPPEAESRAIDSMLSAFAAGSELGQARRFLQLPPLPAPVLPFRTFRTVSKVDGLSIAIVTNDYAPSMIGGITRFLSDVAPALARRGHEVRVVTRAASGEAGGTVDLEDGVWVHRVPATPRGLLPGVPKHIDDFATASAGEIARIATFAPIDVVYGPAWNVAVLGAMRATPLPVVAMLATPVGATEQNDDTRLALPPLLQLEREVLAGADAVHAISHGAVRTIDGHYREALDPELVTVAPIGLADRAAPSADDSSRIGRSTVLYAGRPETRNGTDTFLDAVRRLAPSWPDVRWIVVGEDDEVDADGRSPTRTWIEAVRDEKWFERVEFAGTVDDDQLHARYDAADVVVVLSRDESFGLVAVEAMMHRLPIVSTTTGGVAEIVRDGIDGCLIAPDDAAALSDAVRTLLADGDLRRRMGAHGRRHFEVDFSIDAASERLEALLTSVVEAGLSPHHITTVSAERSPHGVVLRPRSAMSVHLDREWSVNLRAQSLSRVLVSSDDGQAVLALDAGVRAVVGGRPGSVSTVEIIDGQVEVNLRRPRRRPPPDGITS